MFRSIRKWVLPPNLDPRMLGEKHILATSFLGYALLLIAFYMGLGTFSEFQRSYTLLTFGYLVLLVSFYWSNIHKRIRSSPLILQLAIVGILAAATRLALLSSGPYLSEDIFRIEARAQMFLSGASPYEEFAVNKPPLYIITAALFGEALGTNITAFRMIFGLLDVLVALLLLIMPRVMKWKKGWGVFMGVAYALCPLVIIETGLASHYDPLVVILVLGSIMAASRNSGALTGYLLGLGFGLKLFPALILPFAILRLRDGSQRILTIIGFFLGAILGFIPFLLMGNTDVLLYMQEQSFGWESGNTLLHSILFKFGPLVGDTWIRHAFMLMMLFTLVFLFKSVIKHRKVRRSWIVIVSMMWVLQLSIIFMLNIYTHYVLTEFSYPVTMVINSLAYLVVILIPLFFFSRYVGFREHKVTYMEKFYRWFIYMTIFFPGTFLIYGFFLPYGNILEWRFILALLGLVSLLMFPISPLVRFIRSRSRDPGGSINIPFSFFFLMMPIADHSETRKEAFSFQERARSLIKKVLTTKIDDSTMIKASFISITVLLFFSSQFHPWYILWIIPLLLLTKDRWMVVAFLPILILIPSLMYGPRDFPPMFGIPIDILQDLNAAGAYIHTLVAACFP